jgi:hypothetical protein
MGRSILVKGNSKFPMNSTNAACSREATCIPTASSRPELPRMRDGQVSRNQRDEKS